MARPGTVDAAKNMRYNRVFLHSFGYELAPNVMTSSSIEERLAPLYRRLFLQPGQLEAWTGIRERRWWDPDFPNAEGARRAARKALKDGLVPPEDIGVFIYSGVCRDDFEPATACYAAAGLGFNSETEIYDISNACLGVMNGIIDVANRIELGQIKAGMVVSCESARDITNIMIDRILEAGSMEMFKTSLATLTGGSGAVAYLLTNGSYRPRRPKLVGGVVRAAPQYHRICRWGFDKHVPPRAAQIMETDAIAILKHGVELGKNTWEAMLEELEWTRASIGQVIGHQVGSNHRLAILRALDMPPDKDFSTFEYLGNMGTVSVPMTAILAHERGAIENGMRVAFLGIGSGLNCLMLGWEWQSE